MTFDDRAAAMFDGLALGIRYLALRNIVERNDRPDILAVGFEGINFLQACGDARRQPIVNRLHVTDLRA